MSEHDELAAPDAVRARCDRFLDQVQRIRRDHAIAGVLAIGHAALRELYDGSWERALRRGGAQDAPLRLLAEERADELAWHGLTVDRIRNALRAADVDRQLPPATRGQLLPAVLRALAGVPDPSAMTRMANTAVVERWSTRRAQEAVSSWRKASLKHGAGGRPPLAAPVKHARAAARAVAAIEGVEVEGLDAAARAAAVVELRALAAAVAAALGRLEGGAG